MLTDDEVIEVAKRLAKMKSDSAAALDMAIAETTASLSVEEKRSAVAIAEALTQRQRAVTTAAFSAARGNQGAPSSPGQVAGTAQ